MVLLFLQSKTYVRVLVTPRSSSNRVPFSHTQQSHPTRVAQARGHCLDRPVICQVCVWISCFCLPLSIVSYRSIPSISQPSQTASPPPPHTIFLIHAKSIYTTNSDRRAPFRLQQVLSSIYLPLFCFQFSRTLRKRFCVVMGVGPTAQRALPALLAAFPASSIPPPRALLPFHISLFLLFFKLVARRTSVLSARRSTNRSQQPQIHTSAWLTSNHPPTPSSFLWPLPFPSSLVSVFQHLPLHC